MAERSEAVEEQAVRDGSATYAVEPEIATAEDLPPGYKRTEVGMIPEDWNIVSLVGQGKTYGGLTGKTGKDFGVGRARYVPFLGVMDRFFLDDNCLESVNVAPNEAQNSVNAGDILLTGSSETPEEVAMPALVGFNLPNVYLNSFCFGYRLNEKAAFNGRFLVYLISSETGREVVAPLAQGSTRHNISKKALLRVPLPCPPPHEQRAIATALSDADALIESLDRLIAKKRAIKQAAMQQLLTGQTRLPGSTGEWETKAFGQVLERKNLKRLQIQTADYRDSGAYPVVDQGQEAVVGFTDRHDKVFSCPKTGVIVFGDHTCIVKFVDLDFAVGADGTQVLEAKPGQCTRFHGYQLEYDGVQPTGYNRHFKFLKEKMFPVPDEGEQAAIATVLSDIDAEIEALERRRDKARQIKQGMMQQLLTGRVRLVTPEVAA